MKVWNIYLTIIILCCTVHLGVQQVCYNGTHCSGHILSNNTSERACCLLTGLSAYSNGSCADLLPCAMYLEQPQLDYDNDGHNNSNDNCLHTSNPYQEDQDGDGIGDACDNDRDNDGYDDAIDNCPFIHNPTQSDRDRDGVGDDCDNCVRYNNPGQYDNDFDLIGDECDADRDGDGVLDQFDNCLNDQNSLQLDSDGDGVGDTCDNCFNVSNARQKDKDRDGIGDECDNCVEVGNPYQEDHNGDGIGDICDFGSDDGLNDQDSDGIFDKCDNCINVFNPNQTDRDYDGLGDECDNCPLHYNPDQADDDMDRQGNICDNPTFFMTGPGTYHFNDCFELPVADQENFGRLSVESNLTTSEGDGEFRFCVVIDFPSNTCVIDTFPPCLILEIISDSADLNDDFYFRRFHLEHLFAYFIPTPQNCSPVHVCWNITIVNDTILEQDETFSLSVISQAHLVTNETKFQVTISDDESYIVRVEFQYRTYSISEEYSDINQLCAIIINERSECTVGFQFSLFIHLNTSSLVHLQNIAPLVFAPCHIQACTDISLENDDMAEEDEIVAAILERPEGLDERIVVNKQPAILQVTDIDDMVLGFNSTSYTATESDRSATVCVEIANAPTGAIFPFTVLLLPNQEGVSYNQYVLECNLELEFKSQSSVECHDYIITQDSVCEVNENTAQFSLRLGLTSTERLRIDPLSSTTTVTIDDRQEPECYVRVWYENSSYNISETITHIEVCIISSSPGINENYTIISTNELSNVGRSFNFSVSANNPTEIQCFNVTLHYDAVDVCETFNCSNKEIRLNLVKEDETDRVLVNGSTATVSVQLPDKCVCTANLNKQDSSTLVPVVVPSVVILVVLVGIFTIVVLLCKSAKKQKMIIADEKGSHTYVSIDKPEVSRLSSKLREQLVNKKMLISKHQIHLSNTVGQGESGLVYKGYLFTAAGRELVAIKTGKALFTSNDVERINHEVSTMLSFEHPNVMSLLGVCIEGDMPLLIMPFMSKGCVLDFVRKNKMELRCVDASAAMIDSTRIKLMNLCHQVSKGMEYLAQQKFVHRDLAARNCMIDHNGVIKVADFGLTECMYSTNYFRQEKGDRGSEERVPIRWMAPESIEENIYTEATDVWSFGVTVWEIFTCGKVPYPGVPVVSLLKELQGGHRLDKPTNEACSDHIYTEFMQKCWLADPKERPSFKELVARTSILLEKESGYLHLSRSLLSNNTGKDIEEASLSATQENEDKL